MGAEELPPRQWRRRHLRILASRRHRREAAELRALIRNPVHPAHERYLRYRATGGHRCAPYLVIPETPSLFIDGPSPFTRGPGATAEIFDDPPPRGDPFDAAAVEAIMRWWNGRDTS